MNVKYKSSSPNPGSLNGTARNLSYTAYLAPHKSQMMCLKINIKSYTTEIMQINKTIFV